MGPLMSVEFQFDFPRTLAAITYIASQDIPELTQYKILKLLFLADKYHLVRYGRTITGDKYAAMNDGPVPSHIYDLFKKEVLKRPWSDQGKQLAANLQVDSSGKYPILRARQKFDSGELSKSDIEALNKVIKAFRDFDFFDFRDFTHKIAAFDRAWNSRGLFKRSVPMNIEDFFEGDTDAVEGAKAEMIENDQLRKALAERRTI